MRHPTSRPAARRRAARAARGVWFPISLGFLLLLAVPGAWSSSRLSLFGEEVAVNGWLHGRVPPELPHPRPQQGGASLLLLMPFLSSCCSTSSKMKLQADPRCPAPSCGRRASRTFTSTASSSGCATTCCSSSSCWSSSSSFTASWRCRRTRRRAAASTTSSSSTARPAWRSPTPTADAPALTPPRTPPSTSSTPTARATSAWSSSSTPGRKSARSTPTTWKP